MRDVMAGTRVIEVGAWTFVPAAGAILADWGADVLKIEHPEVGDPQRGLSTMGVIPGSAGVDFMMEVPNRGKRSVAIDIATDGGRELLYRLVEVSDVFLTSFLPDARERLGIEVEQIRARNPNIVYARGHGQGSKGPEHRRGGFDAASHWSRGGVADALTPPGADGPISPRAAFGDVMGGLAIAAGISAALYGRERTGEPSVVDVSLLATAMWNLQPDIVMTKALGLDDILRYSSRGASINPLVGNYQTKDGRWLLLNMMQSDRYWADFCEHIGRPDLIEDGRFKDASLRTENRVELGGLLEEVFASRTLAEWREALATMEGVWAPVQKVPELYHDQQVIANGYLRPVRDSDGHEFELVAAPAQFDESPPDLKPCPRHGEHTDEVLQELGLSWDEIVEHKVAGSIL
jgi:crotonobetainyl-CoA:carnitine CoA-transferase CaiB-like acyl-CoA transferase